VRLTPLRVSIAVVVVGALIVIGGLALGSAPTQSTREPVATEADASPDIIPDLGAEPEVVRGSPGSREQVALLGGLVMALGAIGVLGTVSATASRRAREGATDQPLAQPAAEGPMAPASPAR
jgi:hypothetical protein